MTIEIYKESRNNFYLLGIPCTPHASHFVSASWFAIKDSLASSSSDLLCEKLIPKDNSQLGYTIVKLFPRLVYWI